MFIYAFSSFSSLFLIDIRPKNNPQSAKLVSNIHRALNMSRKSVESNMSIQKFADHISVAASTVATVDTAITSDANVSGDVCAAAVPYCRLSDDSSSSDDGCLSVYEDCGDIFI